MHEEAGSPGRADRGEDLGAEEMVLTVIGGKRGISGRFGSPRDLSGLGLHIFPEHGAPFRFVQDVRDPVAFAENVEVLVEDVGNIELVVLEIFREGFEGREKCGGNVHMVGAAVGVAGIVVTAPGFDGRLLAGHLESGFADGAIRQIDRLVAGLGADVPLGVRLDDGHSAALMI